MSDKREEILHVAQHLTQIHGLNGFSYHDISEIVGIKTASIHYYFKTKDDLTTALIKQYHEGLKLRLENIDSSTSLPEKKLRKFSDMFKELLTIDNKFCLCGMMAAEQVALSEESRKELLLYFQSCIKWLTKIFSSHGSKKPEGDAKAYLALLEGALLLARVQQEPKMIDEVSQAFIKK